MTLECNSSSFKSCIFNSAMMSIGREIAWELHAYITEHGLDGAGWFIKAPIPLCRSRHDLAIFSGRAGSGKNLADLEQIRCSNALRTLYLRLARVRYALNTIIGIMSMTSGAQVTLQNDITTLFARCCRCDPISIRPNHAVPPFSDMKCRASKFLYICIRSRTAQE